MKRYSVLLILLFSVSALSAQVRLPKIFGDHMVLQRDQPIQVWGWSSPGERVAVQLDKQSKRVKADKNGKWRVELAALPAGGPFQLVVKGKNTLALNDVLIGEVWICSGQSNMEWSVERSDNPEKEIAAANYPLIRHIKVPRSVAGAPMDDIEDASWQLCTPETVASFTAVGYYFARELAGEVGVPVGLINTSWGGTHVETWTSREAFQSSEEFRPMIASVGKIDLDSVRRSNEKGNVSPNVFPTLLYNAMINPLIPIAFRGAIWYQGESNAGRAYQYGKAFPLMIKDWRQRWGRDFPFYFVQLASFNAANGNSSNGSTWAELREAQTLTLTLPNTGMAVTTDIGDPKDIHPRNKQDVGRRLAALALHDIYGKNIISGGPVYQAMRKDGNKIILSFTDVGKGLMVKDKYGYLKGFEVAGADRKFHYAQARLEGNNVVVYHQDVTDPVAVRFGWSDDAGDCNLYNKEGFPAGPFRTDNWKGVTEESKFTPRK